jgi:carboxylesterase
MSMISLSISLRRSRRDEQVDMTRLGVLCLHGLGGTPHSIMPLTAAIHGAGYTVVAPHLAGHGTRPSDLAECTWDDWMNGVLEAADELTHRCSGVVFVGQSMGATLALVAAHRRDDVRGLAVVNPVVLAPDPDATEHLEHLLDQGRTMQPAGHPDLRDPSAHDSAYLELPLRSLLELGKGAALANAAMSQLDIPLLIASSDHDNVVDPANADALYEAVVAARNGPVTRVQLPNSGHVAALDLDRDLLCRALLTWLADLTDSSATPV